MYLFSSYVNVIFVASVRVLSEKNKNFSTRLQVSLT